MKKLRILLLIIISVYACIGTVFSESPPANSPWHGTFIRDKGSFYSSTLEITDVTANSFKFQIKAYSGGNMGGVSGVAYIKGNNSVFDDGQGGILTFTISNDDIQIEQSYEMNRYCGMGVGFMGQYVNENKNPQPIKRENYFTEFNVFNGNQEQEFKRIVGDNYKKFTNTGHLFFDEKDLDGLGTHVHRIGVRGLFTILESIIMVRDSDNTIWAAVIDGDKVLYFTNANDKRIPKTILHWQERFRNKPIYLQ